MSKCNGCIYYNTIYLMCTKPPLVMCPKEDLPNSVMCPRESDCIEEQTNTIAKDLEVLNIIKKFFFIEAYSDKRLNSDFCKITSIEDKEANIDSYALSFIDRDSLKILKNWLRRVKNDR